MSEGQVALANVTLANADLTVEIAALGAELVRLRDREGRDYLWDGDPAYWKGRAPLLFPMVGRAAGDCIRVNGAATPLPQHGFARVSRFERIEATATRCRMRLQSGQATLSSYPFHFRLDVVFELEGFSVRITATVRNEGQGSLPCSFGFHPAFRWPLPNTLPDEPHEIIFEQPEGAAIRRLADGFLSPSSEPTPVADRRLVLDHSLFENSALIFDQLNSRSVIFRAVAGPGLEVDFPDMPHLGVWTKPGANFICIEPWQGFASAADYDGEFADRPGVVSIAPEAERSFHMTIRLDASRSVHQT
jgi:galactose mutarotase-like enzyme